MNTLVLRKILLFLASSGEATMWMLLLGCWWRDNNSLLHRMSRDRQCVFPSSCLRQRPKWRRHQNEWSQNWWYDFDRYIHVYVCICPINLFRINIHVEISTLHIIYIAVRLTCLILRHLCSWCPMCYVSWKITYRSFGHITTSYYHWLLPIYCNTWTPINVIINITTNTTTINKFEACTP